MNAFDGIISRLHSWRKNLWGRRHIHIKGKRTKTEKQGLCIQGLRGNHRRCDMCNWNTRGDERKKQKIFETMRTENFPKLTPNTKPQIQEAERTSTRISANVLHLDISVRYTENEKGKPWKKPEGKSTLLMEQQRWELHTTSLQKACKQKRVEWIFKALKGREGVRAGQSCRTEPITCGVWSSL